MTSNIKSKFWIKTLDLNFEFLSISDHAQDVPDFLFLNIFGAKTSLARLLMEKCPQNWKLTK